MDDLVERIKGSIENRNVVPWFPELTCALVARAWLTLHRDMGIMPASYGTERVLSRNISAPREVVISLKTCPPTCVTATAISIETLSPQCAAEYQEKGISFYSANEILNPTVLSNIEEALAVIRQVPSLMNTVSALVRSLHVIKPSAEDYDVSFSEPSIPFSIFVSVPETRIPNGALRVAEAIVHEAMHLQLTLIEVTVPLSVESLKEFFSPWREEYRAVQGILHGLYVFRVINEFLKALLSIQEPFLDNLSYVESRCEEIALQMGVIRDFEGCSDLTRLGCVLAKTLISGIGGEQSSRITSVELGNQSS